MNQYKFKQMLNMKKLALGLVLLGSTTSWSQSVILDLETCLKMADTANLSIKNARLDVAINEKQVDVYMTARYPKVSLSGDYRYNAIIPGQVVPAAIFGGPPGTFATLKFGVPINLSNTVQLTQVLYNPQINYGLSAINIQQKIIETQQIIAERDAKQQVASAYFNLQAMTKQLVFIDQNLLNINKLIGNMQAMNKEGLVIGTEVDKLEITKLSLENQKQSLTASKLQLENLLKIQIGLDPKTTIQLASDELIQKTILVDGSSISHPELDLIAAQKEMNIEEKSGTNMAYLPSVAGYAAYAYNYNIDPENDFRTGIESAFIGIKLDWTLFDGFEKYRKNRVNALNRVKIENSENLLTQQLDMQVDNAQRQIGIQTSSLDIAKKQLELSERIMKQTEAQFQQGTISSNDYIQTQNSLFQSQTNVVVSYVSLRQAELEYLKSIGQIK
jgi:outer membrane protein